MDDPWCVCGYRKSAHDSTMTLFDDTPTTKIAVKTAPGGCLFFTASDGMNRVLTWRDHP